MWPANCPQGKKATCNLQPVSPVRASDRDLRGRHGAFGVPVLTECCSLLVTSTLFLFYLLVNFLIRMMPKTCEETPIVHICCVVTKRP